MATPSQHRTRLGPLGQPPGRVNPGDFRQNNNVMPNSSQSQTPSQRQPFSSITGNSVNRPHVSGYGMSAGMKVGRQQGNGRSASSRVLSGAKYDLGARPGLVGQTRPGNRFTHPLAQSQHYQESGSYY